MWMECDSTQNQMWIESNVNKIECESNINQMLIEY